MNERVDSCEQIAAGLGQVAAFLRSASWQEAGPLGLTPTQGACLRLLVDKGPARVTGLARSLGATQATASEVIAALERKGLADRRPDPDDGRAACVHATARGASLAKVLSRPPEALADAVASLSDEENAGLRRALSKIVLQLQRTAAIEPQRLCLTCRFFRPYVHPDGARPHHCTFVDAAFGDTGLRFDCGDHDEPGGGEGEPICPASPVPA